MIVMIAQALPPGDNDVCFDIKFCGICHTDVTFIKNELGNNPTYPLTPGRA